MASPVAAAKSRRLRWALLLALALHGVLLWRLAPRWFPSHDSAVTVAEPPAPQIIDIAPPPLPAAKGHGLAIVSQLRAGSPEQLQAPLPEGFFPRSKPLAGSSLQLAGGLDFSRASGLQIVANIVPAAVGLPARSSNRPRPLAKPAVPAASVATIVAADTVPDRPSAADQHPVPFLLPPSTPDYDVDAAIGRAADAAALSARQANAAAQARQLTDYRQLLPQGPLVAAPVLPPLLGKPGPGGSDAAEPMRDETAQPPLLPGALRAAEPGRPTSTSQQQFFAEVTARLKANNVRMLAAAIRAGPKATVQMQFLVDRDGRLTDLRAADSSDRVLVERAIATLRTAELPRLPETLGDGPVELSFPVEVYR